MTSPGVEQGQAGSVLGISHLERLRRRAGGGAQGPPESWSASEFAVNKAVLDTLGLGFEPTHRFLATERPTPAEFEAWIVAELGGTIDPGHLARARAISDGVPPDERRRDELDALERAPDVLSRSELGFWEENGYVIVRDAAPLDACEALERAIWTHIAADPEDPDSWYGGGRQQGVMVQLFRAPGISEIHASPRIRKAFAQLAGTTDLVMTADRCGFNPPVRPASPYSGTGLHLDLASLEPPVSPGLQGILYLTDTAEDQGALRIIPGFHHRIDAWLESLPADRHPSPEDFERLGPVRSLAAGAGDLIIWSAALPHGPQANTALRPRIVHYLTMYPTPRAA
ncbi:MAG: phytanoyl-CoA dioxygenase family protein [Solirubrobacteraceae bacterium]